ncbi:L,D-transpeptidase family protein [Skermanella mucosa]|uniref:L,D-transpeptidase family protein n=1 Tax=Skermanella mucosa TaxID=1789672 RepID=UPI00192AA24B|nr:L,D-transpeptidase family protein [Skermanella mucosa]UEM20528.1 L,D-transpeptidase family protein [Skermanella mucosa]
MIPRLAVLPALVALLMATLAAALPVRAGGFDQGMARWVAALETRLVTLEEDMPDAAPATRIARGPVLKPGMVDGRVFDLTRRLVELGYLEPGSERDVLDELVTVAIETFQTERGLNPDGKVGGATLAALNLTPAEEVASIRETLSRIAEFSASAPATVVLVNLPAQDLTLVRDGETVLTMETVVGSPSRPTPLLTDTITHVVVNPTWTVPPTILKQDKLPSLRRTGSPGIDHATVWLDGEPVDPAAIDWTGVSPRRVRIVQSAGDHNVLGRFRFNLTNGDHIYLHGTNAPRVFERDRRAVSSGCVRLADPEALADDLLRSAGFTPERITTLVNTGETRWLRLAEPMPVRFVYWPAVLRNDRVVVLPDIYGIVPPPEQIAAAN